MKRREVRWTRRTLARIERIGDHIARDDPSAAERVIARIFAATEALAGQPAMGRPGRLNGTRELVFADLPYLVAYRVTPDTVDILTVLHGAQRWPDAL